MRKMMLLIPALLLLIGCATAPRENTSSVPMVWPPPPLTPRIEFICEIRTAEDAGVVKGWWQKARDKFFGASDIAIFRPYGVFSEGNRLFIVDTGARVIHVMDKSKNRHLVIRGDSSFTFLSPIAVTMDDAGYLYVTDSAAGAVYRVDADKQHVEKFVTGFKRPTGIAYSRINRHIYVADTTANQIIAFDLAGNEKIRFGSRGTEIGQFNYPTDIFVDRLGIVYVTDALNARLQIFTAEGKVMRAMGDAGDSSGHFAKPKGVAVDSVGHIYVADALFDTVQIFDDVGQLLLSFGSSGNQFGEFWIPSGIYIDANDYIFVADAYNSRIQVFRYMHATKEIAENRR